MSLHKDLARGRWFKLANVGMDVERAIRWKQKKDSERSNQAFKRALDLLNLSIIDSKNKRRLKELFRTREALIDYFVYDNEYNSTDQIWINYFYSFNYAVVLRSGR